VQPGGYVPEEVIPILQRHPAVSRLSPLLTTYVRGARDQGDSFLLIGIDPILDRSFRKWRIGGGEAGPG
jgi:putative ABC transport system permease protein